MWRDSLNSAIRAKWAMPLVLALCFVPAIRLVCQSLFPVAGVNLSEIALRRTGDWTLNFLVLTLAVTPLRQFLVLPDLICFRRMLGLCSFFYACLHLLMWRTAHHASDMAQFNVWNLRVAFAGFLLMIPLAATSTTASIQRLGGRRWRMLHTLAYVSTVAGVVHYWGLADSAFRLSFAYIAIVAVLLTFRLSQARSDWSKGRGTSR
jgi:methionine sulfoxide reductase heme-binding subunit